MWIPLSSNGQGLLFWSPPRSYPGNHQSNDSVSFNSRFHSFPNIFSRILWSRFMKKKQPRTWAYVGLHNCWPPKNYNYDVQNLFALILWGPSTHEWSLWNRNFATMTIILEALRRWTYRGPLNQGQYDCRFKWVYKVTKISCRYPVLLPSKGNLMFSVRLGQFQVVNKKILRFKNSGLGLLKLNVLK